MTARAAVVAAQRVVIKLGTRVLTQGDGRPALSRLFAVVEEAAALRRAGKEVLVVSSGAVGFGVQTLGLARRPTDLAGLQACAAVGQSRLMSLYESGFSRLGLVCAQVLLTQGDFDDRVRYLNLRSALRSLLDRGVVPIINENDVVATDELRAVSVHGRPIFGDNDGLSALVASKLHAELLVLLTDVDGLYEKDPRRHEDARLIACWGEHEDAVEAGGAGDAGRGGMAGKLAAARLAARAGCHVVIANGCRPGALGEVLRGDGTGTWFPAGEGASARRRWIGAAAAVRGVLHLDEGAVRALRDRGASLLAVGVTSVDGEFTDGEVVELRGPDGILVGRGLVSIDAEGARRWARGDAPDGARSHHALVHRDHLALEP